MKTSCRDEVISSLTRYANIIDRSANLDKMVLLHEEMINAIYIKKPLFYKMLFRSTRFYVASAIFSIYYSQSNPTLKNIKTLLVSEGKAVSINTLSSLLMLLRVSGRLEVYKHADKPRELCYHPSNSVSVEIDGLVKSMIVPWARYHSDSESTFAEDMSSSEYLPRFFLRYADLIKHHIQIKTLIPQSTLFIDKDAGHMIMLLLYKEYLLQNTPRIILSYKKIADYSHVSRTHICKLLREAEAAGFIQVENNFFIELSDTFINMFRRYFSFYLARILYAFDAEPGAAPGSIP